MHPKLSQDMVLWIRGKFRIKITSYLFCTKNNVKWLKVATWNSFMLHPTNFGHFCCMKLSLIKVIFYPLPTISENPKLFIPLKFCFPSFLFYLPSTTQTSITLMDTKVMLVEGKGGSNSTFWIWIWIWYIIYLVQCLT